MFDDNGKTYEIGEIEGSKPRQVESRFQKKSMITSDILGAQANTKGLGMFENATRKNEPSSQNLISTDIFGA